MSRTALLAVAFAVAAFATAALPAASLSLGEAKAQGLIGEQADGYLGIVGSGPPEARQLVSKVNGERRAEYREIAKKRGVKTESVGALAGKKLMQRTPKGQYVHGSNGRWTKK